MVLPWVGKDQNGSSQGRDESEMILPVKNQNDSSMGWEEPKWFFHGVERTKIVVSCHWEE